MLVTCQGTQVEAGEALQDEGLRCSWEPGKEHKCRRGYMRGRLYGWYCYIFVY